MFCKKPICFVVILMLLAATFSFAQTKRPLTFEDMMQLKRIGDFTVSPDGKWVTFTATDVSLAENTRKGHLWIVPLAGGPERRLTEPGAGTEDRLRFAPDGKRVLFTAVRDGASQIYVQDFDTAAGTLTGQASKATNISTDADGAIWSPDGKQILFVSAVYPDCNEVCTKQRDEERAKSKVKALIFTRLMYRHWNAYGDGKRSHLFIAEIGCGDSVCPARDLTPGDFDVPPFSLGGQDQYQFSPDGKEIAFTSNHDEVEATSTNSDVFILSLTNPNAKPVNLTAANKGNDSTPMYSPDGKWIAIRSQFRAGYESDRFRLQLIDRAKYLQAKSMLCHSIDKKTGEIRFCEGTSYITNLTENFDRWVESFAWLTTSSEDSETKHSWGLYLTAGENGDSPVYFLPVKGGEPRRLIGGFNDSPTPVSESDGRVVFARNSVRFPNDLFVMTMSVTDATKDCPIIGSASAGQKPCRLESETKVAQLTHLNDAVLSQVQMNPVEPFWFTGANKDKVQGFIVKPPNFDAAKKYPVKFLVHGGPQGAWGDDWSFRWNPNMFASDGYVVVMINFHGSTGYGQVFVDAINGNWGGAPFQDLMLGLDYAEKTFPFIDKDRECALGASYGGYMANWLEGHTNRFKCIVSHDGMFNPDSAYGTTEELWFNEWEFKGTPWSNPEIYHKWSPMLAAKNFKTPMLVVHGQLDYRLDVSEGFQLFTTLQRLNVPSKMLYFPDEGHWVLKPQNSQIWYKTVNGWVDQWTKK